MATEQERKIFMEEVVIPFHQNELSGLKKRLEDLEIIAARPLEELRKSREKAAEKEAKKADKDAKKALEKERKEREAQREVEQRRDGRAKEHEERDQEKINKELSDEGLDAKATVGIDEDGKAELTDVKEKK